MAQLEVNRAFLRSPRGSLKISRMLVALAALFCFEAAGSHEAYAALASMEAGITVLFLLLYLLRLDTRIRGLSWPLASHLFGKMVLHFTSLFGFPVILLYYWDWISCVFES